MGKIPENKTIAENPETFAPRLALTEKAPKTLLHAGH